MAGCLCWLQGIAAAWLVYALSRRYVLRLAGRAAVASLASFLGPTGKYYLMHLPLACVLLLHHWLTIRLWSRPSLHRGICC